MGTPRAFANRVCATLAQGDVAAYADLFDLPCVFHSEQGADVRLTRDDLAVRFSRLRRQADELGLERMEVRVVAERPLGASLTALRVETAFHLSGMGRTDPYTEFWVLRDVDGRQRLCLVANPMSARLFGLHPLPAAAPAPGSGIPVPPGSDGVERAADLMLSATSASFASRALDGHLTVLDLPNAKIDDARTEVTLDPVGLRARVARFFGVMRDIGVVGLGQTRRFLRPYGVGMFAMRVEVVAHLGDGATLDPYQELWFLRESGGALRLSAYVNSFAFRNLPDFGPLPIGDAR